MPTAGRWGRPCAACRRPGPAAPGPAPSASTACQPPGATRADLQANRGRGQDRPRIVHHPRVATLRLHHRGEGLGAAEPRRAPSPRGRPPSAGPAPVSSVSASAASATVRSRRRPPASPRRRPTASATSSALPIARPSGWDMSVTAARIGGPSPRPGRTQAPASSAAAFGDLHERAAPGLHVEQDEVCPDRKLLRHHARRDEGDAGHRGGGVAQRVQRTVGRAPGPSTGQRRRTRPARPGAPAPPAPGRSAARGWTRACPAYPPVCPRPRPESFATASPRDAARGTKTSVTPSLTPPVECLSTFGRSTPGSGRVSPGVDHCPGHRRRLSRREPPQERSHEERGSLIVGDLPASVSQHERPELLGNKLLPIPLRRDHGPASKSTGPGTGRSRARSAPQERGEAGARQPLGAHAEEVGDGGPQVGEARTRSQVDRRLCPGPATRAGVYSRVWSVDSVIVGSQPWSPVMNTNPRPSPHAASRSSGRRRSNASMQRAYPSGSLRCPYFESKSTRLVKTSRGPSPGADSRA